ncbi:DMT family transporter [soil metagenome]
MTALLLGVGAAVGWGIADYAGGLASRRIPALWTSIGMQLIGTTLYAVALLVLGRWPTVEPDLLPWAVALGTLGALSLLLLYRALALGPIAVVSPVVAAYTTVTVILIVTFLGERLTLGEAGAIALTFAGVVLASTDLRGIRSLARRRLPGVPVAFVAMLGFGVWGALMTAATREQDQVALILVGRIVGFVVLVAVAAVIRSGVQAGSPGTLALVTVVGAFDTIANVLFVSGVAGGEAALVVTGSGLYPVLPAFLAIVLLGERLALNQYAGVATLVGGLIALGVQRG